MRAILDQEVLAKRPLKAGELFCEAINLKILTRLLLFETFGDLLLDVLDESAADLLVEIKHFPEVIILKLQELIDLVICGDVTQHQG